MEIAVFGAGYVGCVTAAGLVRLGHRVRLVEVVPNKLERLRRGQAPLTEPGLDDIFGVAAAAGTLMPSDAVEPAVRETEAALICVGTPDDGRGHPDLSQVRRVLLDVGEAAARRPGTYVVGLRSTIPAPLLSGDLLPGFAAACGGRFGREVSFALNPEFVREGTALADFLAPPFIVVGTSHAAAAAALRQVYAGLPAPIFVVSVGTASLLKYASNAFHAVKVAFANEIASVAGLFEADPDAVMRIFREDRVLNLSGAYLQPGYAFGGPCLPKDLRALCRVADAGEIACPLLDGATRSNALLIERSVAAVHALGARRVALIGLSYKSQTDDLRESPLVDLARRLVDEGADLRIYDPDLVLGRLQGRNLDYVERHLAPLADLVSADLAGALADADLVVAGKTIPGLSLPERVPPGVPLLDLTRRLGAGPGVLHLQGRQAGPAVRDSTEAGA